MGVLRGGLSNRRCSVCSPYPGRLDIPQLEQCQYEDDLGLFVQHFRSSWLYCFGK